jgi:hypothetical protein
MQIFHKSFAKHCSRRSSWGQFYGAAADKFLPWHCKTLLFLQASRQNYYLNVFLARSSRGMQWVIDNIVSPTL